MVKYRNYIFFGLLITLYLILDYQTILFLGPQGIHFIRQTDSLSFVANYLNNGFKFFQPQVFNLNSLNGHAACEFPLLYYITALLYLTLNEHEFLLRLITLVIASTGFFCLFKLIYSFLNDLVYSLGFCFLFISSTVLLYYSNNFLPDASALGFTLIAWYFFFDFIRCTQNQSALIKCFIFFTISSLLKVTYFINPITVILSIIIYSLIEKEKVQKTFQDNIKPILLFLVSFSLVLSWNLYAVHYNKINQDTYFLVQSRPIWSLNKEHQTIVWDYIVNFWSSSYYYQTTVHVFLAIVIVGLFFIKRSNKLLLIPALILTCGSICYFLLFFAQFQDHDYYFITLIPGLILLVLSSFVSLQNSFPKYMNNAFAKGLLVSLTLLSLNYAHTKLNQRYENVNDKFSVIGQKLSGMRNYLDSLGVPSNAKVIIISDLTPNGGLYFINRPGWILPDTSSENLVLLNKYIKKGTEYLLFTNEKYIIDKLPITEVGELGGVYVYKLR